MEKQPYQEKRPRGRGGFPLEFHRLEWGHPRFQMPLHWHMEEELIWVEKGRLALQWDGIAIPLEAGDCVLLRGGALHTAKADPDCRYRCLVLDGSAFFESPALPGVREFLQEGEERHRFPAGSAASRCAETLFRQEESRNIGWECAVTGNLWQLMALLLADPFREPVSGKDLRLHRVDTVKIALRRIRRDYGKPLTLGMLAKEAGMSPNYFCRLFREVVGRSPGEYLCGYRLEMAAEKLCSTDASVTEIALCCGFNDAGYFSRAFHREKGCSPREYRKKKTMG